MFPLSFGRMFSWGEAERVCVGMGKTRGWEKEGAGSCPETTATAVALATAARVFQATRSRVRSLVTSLPFDLRCSLAATSRQFESGLKGLFERRLLGYANSVDISRSLAEKKT